jgi:hypothetical protein
MATIPQPVTEKSDRVVFRLEPDQWERLNIYCIRRRSSLQAVCAEAVMAVVDKNTHELGPQSVASGKEQSDGQ